MHDEFGGLFRSLNATERVQWDKYMAVTTPNDDKSDPAARRDLREGVRTKRHARPRNREWNGQPGIRLKARADDGALRADRTHPRRAG